MKKLHPSHDWVDTSYHGSASYDCRFCDCSESSKAAEKPCPKAKAVLKREAEEREKKDRAEYERMKARIQRYKDLKARFDP